MTSIEQMVTLARIYGSAEVHQNKMRSGAVTFSVDGGIEVGYQKNIKQFGLEIAI